MNNDKAISSCEISAAEALSQRLSGGNKVFVDKNKDLKSTFERIKEKLDSKALKKQQEILKKKQIDETKEQNSSISQERTQAVQEDLQSYNKRIALENLEKFDLTALVFTKKGDFHKRRIVNNDYFKLCSIVGVHPFDFYTKNSVRAQQTNPQPNNTTNTINYINNIDDIPLINSYGLPQYPIETLQSTKTFTTNPMIGFTRERANSNPRSNSSSEDIDYANRRVDLRINERKREVAMKIEQAKEELTLFDTTQLIKRNNGELDKRSNINKAYIELKEKCLEVYYL